MRSIAGSLITHPASMTQPATIATNRVSEEREGLKRSTEERVGVDGEQSC